MHINDLYKEDNENFYQGYHPFISDVAIDKQDLKSFAIDKLNLKYSNRTVSYYPHNMKHSNAGQYFRNLSFALEELENPIEVYHSVDASEE